MEKAESKKERAIRPGGGLFLPLFFFPFFFVFGSRVSSLRAFLNFRQQAVAASNPFAARRRQLLVLWFLRVLPLAEPGKLLAYFLLQQLHSVRYAISYVQSTYTHSSRQHFHFLAKHIEVLAELGRGPVGEPTI